MGALDLPSEPDVPGPAERYVEGGADRPRTREQPGPEERERAYEAMPDHGYAETGDAAEPGRYPDGTGARSYWDEVPRFVDMRADHEKRWPRSPAPADRTDDPPGVDAATTEAACRVREAEPGISADAQAIEQENDHGGWLEGFEFRVKEEDSLKEKVITKLEAEPRMTAVEALRDVSDAIRYTYCFQLEVYVRGYYDIKERLESRGHEMWFSKNWWTHREYKGINTRWISPDGQRFEVQFHTPESFHAKHHVTHSAYERIRDSTTSRRELRELHEFQREVCSRIRVPEGAPGIPDFRKEGF